MASAIHEQCSGKPRARRVLMFPLPFQGHINPMLQLADVLHGRGLAVTVLHTRFNALDPALHPEFDFVSVPDGVPADVAASGSVVATIQAINDAMEANKSASLRGVLESVLADQGQPPAACIIIDANLLAVPTAAAAFSLPAIAAHREHGLPRLLPCLSNASREGLPAAQRVKIVYAGQGAATTSGRDLFYSSMSNHETMQKLLARATETTKKSAGIVINTFDELESAELERIRGQLNIPIVLAVGPLHKLA